MNILVTGGSGFLGRRLVRLLQRLGHAVDAPSHAECDVLDARAVRRHLERNRPDAVAHLAWIATPGSFWQDASNLDWTAASLQLVRSAVTLGTTTFVAAGSCAEYAWTGELLTEDRSPVRPATLYGTAKHAFHQVAERYARESGVRFAWARIFFPYGSAEPPEKFVSRVAGAVRRGERFEVREPARRLDYLHADDVAAAFATLLEDGTAAGSYNIASGSGRVMSSFAREIADAAAPGGSALVVDSPAPASPPDVVGSNERLRLLGWAPRVSAPAGIADTIGLEPT